MLGRLGAIEAVATEVVEVFGDLAVIPDSMATLLAEARSGLESVYSHGADLLSLDSPPEADQDLIQQLRLGVQNA